MADWTHQEVDLIIADYFDMLSKELSGLPYNKTFHRNSLKTHINRPDGSIERKHQNISAILMQLGLPFIKGYKPLSNYQKLLENKVIDVLTERLSGLEEKFETFAESSPIQPAGFDIILVDPPQKQNAKFSSEDALNKRPFKINYLEREQRNVILGSKGEELILEYEERRLIEAGKPNLARAIEWISKFDDSAGYDILSKNIDGTDKYIEVKTTKLTKETPIFFSNREYKFSIKARNAYHLYRVFNFSERPMMFNMQGSFDDFCQKEIIQYKGIF